MLPSLTLSVNEAQPWDLTIACSKPTETVEANIPSRGSTRSWLALVCGAHFMSTMVVTKSGN